MRPEGADHQRRKIPPGKLSIDPVADERLGRVTGRAEYETSDEALKAALEIKRKFPYCQVKVFGAKEQTRTLVELPEQSDKKTESAS